MVRKRLLKWVVKVASVEKETEIEKIMRRHTINHHRTQSKQYEVVKKKQEELNAANASGDAAVVAKAQDSLEEAKTELEREFFDKCWEDEIKSPKLQSAVSKIMLLNKTFMKPKRGKEQPKHQEDAEGDATTTHADCAVAGTSPSVPMNEWHAVEVFEVAAPHNTTQASAKVHPA